MKITTINNSEIVIQANTKKSGDWALVQQVAKAMIDNAFVELAPASQCEDEQWIHLTAVWGNKQADDIKSVYVNAKKNVKAGV